MPRTAKQAKGKQGAMPTVKLTHPSYQPLMTEKEQDMSIDATPEELARAVMQRVEVQYTKPPRKRKKRQRKNARHSQ